MKDYRLSEAQAICEKRKRRNASCIGCEMEQFCFALNPASVDIDPRDMIELPCKCQSLQNGDWLVYYRSSYDCNLIELRAFSYETNADAFLAELKGGNNQ